MSEYRFIQKKRFSIDSNAIPMYLWDIGIEEEENPKISQRRIFSFDHKWKVFNWNMKT